MSPPPPAPQCAYAGVSLTGFMEEKTTLQKNDDTSVPDAAATKSKSFEISRIPIVPESATNRVKTKNATANVLDAWSYLDEFDTLTEFEKKSNCRLPTKKESLSTVPKHCFIRSNFRSLSFLVRDLLFAATAASLAYMLDALCISQLVLPARVAFFVGFALIQGTILTGIWVIGHECGHRGFSSSTLLCDIVGFVCHSALLVPYFSWQYTHAKHHKYTNHLIWGETHVPGTSKGFSSARLFAGIIGDDAFAISQLIEHLVFGWPMYLCFYVTGGKCNWRGERIKKNGVVDHFRGKNSEIFPPEWENRVAMSTFGICVALAVYGIWVYFRGIEEFSKYFLGPYLVVNAWLVLYTWLQHTHPNVPHFGSESFSWMRGALATVDRPYPWIVDELHHHIGSTHVLHHIDSSIPQYHAVEATKALKEVLGPLYRYDPTPIFRATLDIARSCHYVEGVENVQYYRSRRDFLISKKLNENGHLETTPSKAN